MSDKKTKKRDIVHRLCEKAAMIYLGEKIEFGSETRLMCEAADEIERLRAALAAGRARILEEAARIAIGNKPPDVPPKQDTPYGQGREDAAAAIRAAKEGEG